MQKLLKSADRAVEIFANTCERHFEIITVVTWLTVIAVAIAPLCLLP